MATWTKTIAIDAGPGRVWEVLVDVEKWPEWTPSITSVERRSEAFGPGALVMVHAKGTPKSLWRISEWTPGRSFTWETSVRGARTIGSHVIEGVGEGRSRVTLTVEVQGLGARLFSWFIGRGISENLRLESEGLKRRSEAGVTTAPGE